MPAGSDLAAARAAAGLTVEDVARTTKVRAGLLRQIEADDFSSCGGDVYARGHLRSMAQAVGVDAAPFIATFDRERGVPQAAPVAVEQLTFQPDKVSKRALKARTGPNWTAWAVAAAGVVAAFLVVSYATNPSSSVPTAGDVPPTVVTTSAAPAPSTAPTQDQNLTAFTGVDVKMTVSQQPSWVSVTDGVTRAKLFEGILQPGASQEFRADSKIVFTLGNAGAVSLTVNGRDIGSPGQLGQVVNQTYGPGDPAAQTQG